MGSYTGVDNLTNEELVKTYQQTKDTEILNQIIEDNEGLIHHILKRYRVDQYDYDDLFQEGSIGMLKAIDSFDTTKGTKFSTHAFFQIRSQATKYLEQTNVKHQEVSSLNTPVGEEGNIELQELIEDENIDIEELIKYKLYNEELKQTIVDTCTIEEQKAIHLYYYLDVTYKEVQKALGFNYVGKVNTIIDRSLRNIRRSPFGVRGLEELREKNIDDRTSWIRNQSYDSIGTGNSSNSNSSPVERLVLEREKMREEMRLESLRKQLREARS